MINESLPTPTPPSMAELAETVLNGLREHFGGITGAPADFQLPRGVLISSYDGGDHAGVLLSVGERYFDIRVTESPF